MLSAAALIIVAILYRVILGIAGSSHFDWLHNFSPLAAIALCGAIYFPRRVAIAFPLLALFLSDLVLNAHYREPLVTLLMLPEFLAFGLIAALGWQLRSRPQLSLIFGASLVSSVLFYLLTNTGAWLGEPLYPKTIAGWMQSMTTGLNGYPSTLSFFRNTVVSDALFTLLFVFCMRSQAKERDQHAAADLPALAQE